MKKYLIGMGVAALLIAGCTGNTSRQEAEAENLEIMKADSISSVIDSLKEDIDASVRELDTLLDEL